MCNLLDSLLCTEIHENQRERIIEGPHVAGKKPRMYLRTCYPIRVAPTCCPMLYFLFFADHEASIGVRHRVLNATCIVVRSPITTHMASIHAASRCGCLVDAVRAPTRHPAGPAAAASTNACANANGGGRKRANGCDVKVAEGSHTPSWAGSQ